MEQHTILDAGIGLGNLTHGASQAPVVSKPYLKQFVIPLPIVASASAQSIAPSSIKGWPTSGLVQVIGSSLNEVVAPTAGTTKTVSVGYTAATTAFFNAQTIAATGKFAGAAVPAVNISAVAAIIYALGSANISLTAQLELVLTCIVMD